MKDKSFLVLIEQLMMIVIFAIISALCIQVFIKADQISINSENRDRAVIMVQNAAEKIAAGEDIENAYYDENWNIVRDNQDYTYSLVIETTKEMKNLEEMVIKVTDRNMSILFEIKIARQVKINE